jgi:hypothetical protein
MHEKLLNFGHMCTNKNIFLIFEIRKFLHFWILLFKFQRKTSYFNNRSVYYNISLQLDIKQNCWKNT